MRSQSRPPVAHHGLLRIMQNRPNTIYNIKPNNQPLPRLPLPLPLSLRFLILEHSLFRFNTRDRTTLAALMVPHRALSLVITRGKAFAAALVGKG